jgi:hypothetical protein
MTAFAATLATSILTVSIALYFGVIMALLGLLLLAGTAGKWILARTWFPALFEHLGIVMILLAITFRVQDLIWLGLSSTAMGVLYRRDEAATLNPAIEAPLLASALVSIAVLAVVHGFA